MTTFVLVHGSWHGSWCWKELTALLRRDGHEVHAPTLTGCGADIHNLSPDIDLTTHVADVTNLLFYEDLSDVVLVAHSYGGMVAYCVSVAASDRIAGIVYLDGYLPEPGRDGFSLWPAERVEQARAALAAGDAFREPKSAADLGISDPALASWTDERLTPHPIRTYETSVPAPTSESARLPRTYVLGTRGTTAAMFAAVADRLRVEGIEIQEIPAGHNAMMTHADVVADIVRRFAAELPG